MKQKLLCCKMNLSQESSAKLNLCKPILDIKKNYMNMQRKLKLHEYTKKLHEYAVFLQQLYFKSVSNLSYRLLIPNFRILE